jgi:hypothetical protein
MQFKLADTLASDNEGASSSGSKGPSLSASSASAGESDE